MNPFDRKVWDALVALQQACADAGTDLQGVVMRNVPPGFQVTTSVGPISIGTWLGAWPPPTAFKPEAAQ